METGLKSIILYRLLHKNRLVDKLQYLNGYTDFSEISELPTKLLERLDSAELQHTPTNNMTSLLFFRLLVQLNPSALRICFFSKRSAEI